MESDVFKASCELIIEWTEKVLEAKFDTIQSIAEHLIGNLFVNTKSVAAFTLKGSLQECGNNAVKGTEIREQRCQRYGNQERTVLPTS